MTDVKKPVGFRRKTRHHSTLVLAGLHVPFNHHTDEVGRRGSGFGHCGSASLEKGFLNVKGDWLVASGFSPAAGPI
jgi:hypothetical protein